MPLYAVYPVKLGKKRVLAALELCVAPDEINFADTEKHIAGLKDAADKSGAFIPIEADNEDSAVRIADNSQFYWPVHPSSRFYVGAGFGFALTA